MYYFFLFKYFNASKTLKKKNIYKTRKIKSYIPMSMILNSAYEPQNNYLANVISYIFRYYIEIFCLITILISFFIFVTMIIILILDKSYRPNIPQYPYNIFFDRIIPLIVLITPSIIISYQKPFNTWFAGLSVLILTHIFILIPLFKFWSQLRSWRLKKDNHIDVSWSHPRLYEHISIAIIYPLLWGLFFASSRFLRLGTTINIYDYFYLISPDFCIILFLLPHIILWLLIPFSYILRLRSYLWNQLSSLLYSIHIHLLKYYIYFKLMEYIYKMCFLFFSVFTLNMKKKITWLKKLINFFYYHPQFSVIGLFIFILLEIFLTNKVYFSIYFIFIYALIYSFFSLCFTFLKTDFVFDCCLSDYISQREMFQNPRYPIRFWFYFQDAEYYFGYEYKFTEEQLNKIQIEIKKHKSQWLIRKKVSSIIHQSQLKKRIFMRTNSPFCLRLAVCYLQMNQVRWVHTERIINAITQTQPYKYHSCTALFTKSIYDKIVLLNSNWTHMHHIQVAQNCQKYIDKPFSMYKNFNQTFSYKKTYFIGIQEENIPSNFESLIQKGVIVEPYDEQNSTHKPVHKIQAQPDIINNFAESSFRDKRCHAMDQKTNNPGLGNNKLLSEITSQRYESTLMRFQRHFLLHYNVSREVEQALNELNETKNNFINHQLIWAKNLHLFPDTFIPPLKLPQNFSYAQLTLEALQSIKISEIRLQKISTSLYQLKIPEINHGKFPNEALDLFNGSFLQELLGE